MKSVFDILEHTVDSLLRRALPYQEQKERGRISHGIRKKKLPPAIEQQIRQQWAKINQLQELGGPSQLRQAVIEADKLIDKILKYIVEGDTMGERLKESEHYFADYAVYDQLWKAHKLRNAIVHEADFHPTHMILKQAIGDFKAALDELL